MINLFRVVVVSPAFGVDTNQKKHGYHGLDTDWSFTDLFFDIIELMILGFDLFGFASAGALPFPGGIAIVTQHIDNSPHLASPEGEGQIVLNV